MAAAPRAAPSGRRRPTSACASAAPTRAPTFRIIAGLCGGGGGGGVGEPGVPMERRRSCKERAQQGAARNPLRRHRSEYGREYRHRPAPPRRWSHRRRRPSTRRRRRRRAARAPRGHHRRTNSGGGEHGAAAAGGGGAGQHVGRRVVGAMARTSPRHTPSEQARAELQPDALERMQAPLRRADGLLVRRARDGRALRVLRHHARAAQRCRSSRWATPPPRRYGATWTSSTRARHHVRLHHGPRGHASRSIPTAATCRRTRRSAASTRRSCAARRRRQHGAELGAGRCNRLAKYGGRARSSASRRS